MQEAQDTSEAEAALTCPPYPSAVDMGGSALMCETMQDTKLKARHLY